MNKSANDVEGESIASDSKQYPMEDFEEDDKNNGVYLIGEDESSDESHLRDNIDSKKNNLENNVEIEITKSAVPDGGWGWLIVFGSFLVHLIIGGIRRSHGVLYLEMLNKFGRTATETSWVLAISSTITLCAGPLVSAMCNKLSLRFVVFLGSILASSGLILSGFSPKLTFMYFSYGALTGFGFAMVYMPCLVIVGHYFNKRRGIAVGLATSGGGVGSFIFPPMFEHLFGTYSFSGAFLILAAVACNFLISTALYRPLQHQKKKELSVINKNCKENGEKKEMINDGNNSGVNSALLPNTETPTVFIQPGCQIQQKRKQSFVKVNLSKLSKVILRSDTSGNKQKHSFIQLSLFRNYAYTTVCLQILVFNLSFVSTFVFLPALVQSKGLTKLQGAYLLSILGIFDAVSRIVISFILDLKQVKRFRLIIYNLLLFFICGLTILIPLMSKFWQFSIICALYGIMTGTYVSQKSVIIVDILGIEKLASSFGLLLLFQGTGSFIGPIIGGLLRDSLGTYEMSFYCGAAGIFVGALILVTGNVWLHIQKKKSSRSI